MGTQIKNFYHRFLRDETPRLAASLAFYTLFAVAPFILLLMTIAGYIGIDRQIRLVSQVRELVNPEAANFVRTLITASSLRADLSSLVGVFSVFFWALSASLLISELQAALTRIFDGRPPPWQSHGLRQDILSFLNARLHSLLLVLVFALTALFALFGSSFVSFYTHHHPSLLLRGVSFLISTLIYFVGFTSAYLYIPKGQISLRRAALGGAITAILFVFGKEVIGLYIGKTGFQSAYGATGSLVVLLVWIYYSCLIFFAGAQLTVVLIKE